MYRHYNMINEISVICSLFVEQALDLNPLRFIYILRVTKVRLYTVRSSGTIVYDLQINNMAQ